MESTQLLRCRRQATPSSLQTPSNDGRSLSTMKKFAMGIVVTAVALGVAYVAHDLYETKKQQVVGFEPASLLRDNFPAPPPLTMAEQHEIKDLGVCRTS